MSEVSCRSLVTLLKEIERQNISETVLLAGTGYSAKHIRDASQWISWAAMCRIMCNLTDAGWTDENFIETGRRSVLSPTMKAILAPARLLFSTQSFYEWVSSERGGGQQFFTCVSPHILESVPGYLKLDLRLKEGFPMCPQFFVMSKGGYAAVCELLGLPRANVKLELVGQSGRYEIRYTMVKGLVGQAWEVIRAPWAAQAVARELLKTNQQLREKYVELEDAREKIDAQATQLRTAHLVGEVVQKAIDLDPTLAAIVRALTDVAGFARVEIHIRTTLAGREFQRNVKKGEARNDTPQFRRDLIIRDMPVGELTLWMTASAGLTERASLLEVVFSGVMMAIEGALNYAQLVELRDQLEGKVEIRTMELTATVKNLTEAQAARDRIFANINHEIRTPLTIVKAATAELRRVMPDDPHAVERLDLIDRGVAKLLRLVDGILTLAAKQEGKLILRKTSCDLVPLVKEITDTFMPVVQSAELQLDFFSPDDIWATVDSMAVERMLANLLSNAIKFTPKKGKLWLSVGTDRDDIVISVRDSGVGINEEFRSRIFGRFEQGATPVTGVRGSGLGLSLVRELAEAHGGSIEVLSPLGGGSEFVIRMPWIRPDHQGVVLHEQRRSPSQPEVYGVSVSDVSDLKIFEAKGPTDTTLLLVEDEPSLGLMIGEMLATDYRVLWVQSGELALQIAAEHSIGLLVTDVGLPKMDGFALARQFRAMPNHAPTPIIMITAYSDLKHRLAGLDTGAVDYVVKPFEPAELRARVSAQLKQRSLMERVLRTEKLAAIGMLSSGLAHEIRNPANGIVNAIEPLYELLPAEFTQSGPTSRLLGVIRDCAAQVAVISKQLLTFRREGELDRQEVLFSHVFSRSLAVNQQILSRVDVREKFAYDGAIWCAGALLAQVLSNLVENGAHAALDAQKDGETAWVQVATMIEDDRFVIEVSDSGAGVPPALREKIFEPFFTTKSPGTGVGLGLPTSREIVERHHGSLTVKDRGNHTLFRCEIPFRHALRSISSDSTARNAQ